MRIKKQTATELDCDCDCMAVFFSLVYYVCTLRLWLRALRLWLLLLLVLGSCPIIERRL